MCMLFAWLELDVVQDAPKAEERVTLLRGSAAGSEGPQAVIASQSAGLACTEESAKEAVSSSD